MDHDIIKKEKMFRLEENKKLGRHVLASQIIPKSETILRESPSLLVDESQLDEMREMFGKEIHRNFQLIVDMTNTYREGQPFNPPLAANLAVLTNLELEGYSTTAPMFEFEPNDFIQKAAIVHTNTIGEKSKYTFVFHIYLTSLTVIWTVISISEIHLLLYLQ
ncbi:hypothetical protein EON65_53195, partial [archaeon]